MPVEAVGHRLQQGILLAGWFHRHEGKGPFSLFGQKYPVFCEGATGGPPFFPRNILAAWSNLPFPWRAKPKLSFPHKRESRT